MKKISANYSGFAHSLKYAIAFYEVRHKYQISVLNCAIICSFNGFFRVCDVCELLGANKLNVYKLLRRGVVKGIFIKDGRQYHLSERSRLIQMDFRNILIECKKKYLNKAEAWEI